MVKSRIYGELISELQQLEDGSFQLTSSTGEIHIRKQLSLP